MTNQNKTRDSFIFYRSFFSATKHLNQVEKAQLFEAICSYALDGNLSLLEGTPQGMFELIKPQLDANRKRFENGCKKKQKISKTEAKNKQTISKDEANVNVNVNVNHNEECKSELINDNLNNNSKGVEIVDLLSQKMADLESLFNKQTNALEYGNSDFENFWQYYTPVTGKDGSSTGKGGKNEAMQVYNKARKEFSHLTIMTNLEFYLKDCQKNARFTKHVSSWLRQAHKDKFHCEVSTVIKSQAPPQKLNRDQEQDRINEEFLKLYAKN